MPIYAFACTACGHHFDRLQKLSDPDPAACPVCSAEAVKRQLTAPSFRLSGSGWYETDFKKDGDKKRNLTEKAEGGSSGDTAKTEAKSEAKPADSKPADSKGAEAKPVAKPAKAEPAPAAKPASGTP
jgi:putative FmdB family regulatory protein